MILITGAAGFVGQHLLATLTARLAKSRIRAFDTSRPSRLFPDDVEAIFGSVEDAERLPFALEGADAIVHLAARAQPDSRDLESMRKTNVDGSRNVYSAAVRSGCKLFVHMSSAGIYGPPSRLGPFREYDTPRPQTAYQRTKWEAEEALRSIDNRGTTLIILRPAGMYGPGSHLEIPMYRKILAQRRSIEFPGSVVVHPTNVRDVVEAVLAVLSHPAPHGSVFNVGGERRLRLEDLYALVAEFLEARRRRFVVPPWLAAPLVAVTSPMLSVTGRSNPMLAGMSRGELFYAAVDDRPFRERYVDVPVVPLEQGVRDHLEWARAERLL